MRTIHEAFLKTATERPDAACICVPSSTGRDYLPDGAELSYADVEAAVSRLKAIYSGAGYGHGHTIALMMANRPDFMLHWLAHNALGICTVPINPDYRPAEIAFVLERARVDLAVCLPSYMPVVSEAAAALERLIPVVADDRLREDIEDARTRANPEPPGRDTPTGILFTSGTSGLPKACVLTNEYLFFAGGRYRDAGGLIALKPHAERLYNPLPLFYANSFGISNSAMILTGGCMIFPDRFHPSSWWREVVETRATIVHYLGIIPPVLLRQDVKAEETLHQVRFGVGAGAPPSVQRAFQERFGLRLVEVWGMTEVGICTAENRTVENSGNLHSIGWALDGIDIRIGDQADEEVPAGEVGEILVRRQGSDPRSGLFSGYLGDAETTRSVWRNDWFHTGDLARRGDDGRLVFVDRLKHMIRRSGQNIAAAEVETALAGLHYIAEMAVIAAPDELRDEEVMACIVPKPGATPGMDLARDIFAAAAEHLAYFKLPGWIVFVDSLPRTSTEKLRKSELADRVETLRRSDLCFDLRDMKKRKVLA